MKTRFRESFAEDLAALTEARLLRRIKQVEAAATFQQIANLKRLEARGKYYHIRVGNYRVGLVFEDGAVTFVRCLDRKEIYPKNGDRWNHGFHGFHRLHGFSDLRVADSSATLHPQGEQDSRSKCLVIRVIRAIRGSYFRI